MCMEPSSRIRSRLSGGTVAWILAVAGAIVVGTIVVASRSRRRAADAPIVEADVPSASPSGVVASDREERRRGTPHDRGRMPAYALDVERIRTREGMEPVVQYLTFIQSQRGDDSTLLFVRYEDIDAMAAIEGTETGDFLERLDQLGVVVSNN